jgi:hypothetical protein
MPRLDLTDDEARELGNALTAQLHSLRVELSAAEVRQFKHDLRERLDRLEQVAARLAARSRPNPTTTTRPIASRPPSEGGWRDERRR